MRTRMHGWSTFGALMVTGLVLAACSGGQPPGGSDGSGATLPAGPIEVTLPLPPGGPSDTVARALVDQVNQSGKLAGNTVQVVNRPGGNNTVAAAHVQNARPDGTTIGFLPASTLTLIPLLGEVPFDPAALDVILSPATQGVTLVVRGDAKWKTMQEFLEDARANPGQLTIGNAGAANQSMSSIYALEQKAGVDLREVAFEGGAAAVTALLGGNVDSVLTGASAIMGQMSSGELRGLASFLDEGDPATPDVPGAKEVGIGGVFTGVNYILALPQGVPDDVRTTIITAFTAAAASKQFADVITPLAAQPATLVGAAARTLLDQEIIWYRNLFESMCPTGDNEMCKQWNANR